jgi:8-amino-3,8-dideoxy-alpha-D-manno-octulosonate transaminase
MPGYELIGEEEKSALLDVINRSGIFFRYGFDKERKGIYKVKEFEEKFAQYMSVKYAQAVSSGTAALRVALAALDIGKDDEVITSCFTFVATVEAILEAGAEPVICEINETLNILPEDIEKKITKRTKAIIPIHMLGVPAEMKEIMEIARKYNLFIIEDACQSCGSSYFGKKVGTLGNLGCYSFDFVKTITTGEGGMVVTNNKDFYLRSSWYADHGHEHKPDIPRGEDTKSIAGFNYRMNELQSAIGLVQLSRLDYVIQEQRKNKEKIKNGIKNIKGLKFRERPDPDGDGGDTLVVFLPTPEQAKEFAQFLNQEKVPLKILPSALGWHYFPNWPQIYKKISRYKKYKKIEELFPHSDEILKKSVAISISVIMSEETINRIIETFHKAAQKIL